jgi:hypothetical protein
MQYLRSTQRDLPAEVQQVSAQSQAKGTKLHVWKQEQ